MYSGRSVRPRIDPWAKGTIQPNGALIPIGVKKLKEK